eukprot:2916770-Ditylum_brightwellii.AAC.1
MQQSYTSFSSNSDGCDDGSIIALNGGGGGSSIDDFSHLNEKSAFSVSISILPSNFFSNAAGHEHKIDSLPSLAPDSLVLHHLQSYSSSILGCPPPSTTPLLPSEKVIQVAVHTKGPNWGLSSSFPPLSSSSSSTTTLFDKIRVWKVWYDDARNHLRHMERDTPGEEHDRQLFKYVVDVEKEEDEQHRLALQQHIHYNENMKKVEHQQQQEQQAEEQEAEEHQ